MAKNNQDGNKFCLKWDAFESSIATAFEALRKSEELVDVTLCCDGKKLKAHKIMLSASSPYFKDILKDNPCKHPVFFMRDTNLSDIRAILEFIYCGSVNVEQSQLASFIKTAESLQIRGLSGDEDGKQSEVPEPGPVKEELLQDSRTAARVASPIHQSSPSVGRRPSSPPTKRRRVATPPPAPSPTRIPLHEELPLGDEISISALPAPPQRTSEPAPPVSFTPRQDAPAAGLVTTGELSVEFVDSARDMKAEVYDVEDSGDGEDFSQEPVAAMQYEQSGMMGASQVSALPGSAPYPTSFSGGSKLAPPTPGSSSGNAEESSQGSSDQPAHQCEVCGSRYKNPWSLVEHSRVHEGRTICPLCGRLQSRVTNLRRHLVSQHRLTKEQAAMVIPRLGTQPGSAAFRQSNVAAADVSKAEQSE